MPADSVALVRADTTLPSPREWETMLSVAQNLVESGLLPNHIKTPQAAVAIVLKGRELGIPAMYALANIVVVQQKPTANAELMLALIYRDHGDEAIQIERTDAEACILSYKRRSWTARRSFTFAIEDARRANLLKNPTWNSYPAAMLRARCISAVARAAFPDSIGGLYTPEELGARVAVEDGEAVVLAEAEAPAAGSLHVVEQGEPAHADEPALLQEEIAAWHKNRPDLVQRVERKYGAWRAWDLDRCRKALEWFHAQRKAEEQEAAQQHQTQQGQQEIGEAIDPKSAALLERSIADARALVADISTNAAKGRPHAGDFDRMRAALIDMQGLDGWEGDKDPNTIAKDEILPYLKARLAGYEQEAREGTVETAEEGDDADRPF